MTAAVTLAGRVWGQARGVFWRGRTLGLAARLPALALHLRDTATPADRNAALFSEPEGRRFKSPSRDWCADTGVAPEVAEAALAHAVGGVEGAYKRTDFFNRRRPVMDDWACYMG